MLSPVLEKVTKEDKSGSGKALDLVTVDTDVEMELAKQYQVCRVPLELDCDAHASSFIDKLPPDRHRIQ